MKKKNCHMYIEPVLVFHPTKSNSWISINTLNIYYIFHSVKILDFYT